MYYVLVSNHQRSLAEQCHTQIFYLRCFKSDIDAVKRNLIYALTRLKIPTIYWKDNFTVNFIFKVILTFEVISILEAIFIFEVV